MKAVTGFHWIDADPAGEHGGLLGDLARFMRRFSSRFAGLDLHYVDPWERKRR